MNKFKVLVSLDVLIDSRLGVLINTFGKKEEDILVEEYKNRFRDDFPWLGVREKEFRKAYVNRSVSDLMSGKPTQASGLLFTIFMETFLSELKTPERHTPAVYVNVAGYDLQDDEKELIINAMIQLMPPKTEIYVVEEPLERLTLDYINNRYNSIFIYEFDEWQIEHTEGHLQAKPSLTQPVFMCGKFLRGTPSEETSDKDPWRMLELCMSPIMRLTHKQLALLSAS